MHIILAVSVLLLFSATLGVQINTIQDYLSEELHDASSKVDLRVGFNTEAFMNNYGYPFETHHVTTEDGYILALHRIPYGRNESNSNTKRKPAVLFMHCLAGSSPDFFMLGPERSLALMLADEGYDVWLGNNRGNTWSRNHTTLDPDKDDIFWDYSFHELGIYDTPALIDHILMDTGNEKISYVGHSQGTTQFFIMASIKPEYNDKINLMVALGPVAYGSNMPSPIIQILKNYTTFIEVVANLLDITEFIPHSTFLTSLLQLLCQDTSPVQEVFAIFLLFIFGFDSDQLNRTTLPTFFEHFPAGISIKEVIHFSQEFESGHFRQYDYGLIQNLLTYNSPMPPDYNVSLITAPVALYYGQNDWLVGIPDVDRLAEELPYVEKHLIDYEYFTHLDFIFAIDAVSLLYNDVINVINIYNRTVSTSTTTTPSTTTVTTTTTISSNSTTTSILTTTPSAGFSSYNVIELVCITTGMIIVNFLF